MRIKFQKKEKGFSVLLLDFLFVAIGLLILIVSLLENKDLLASISSLFLK